MDDRRARRYPGRPNPLARYGRAGHNRLLFRDFPGIPPLARVTLGCEPRDVGRDMLIDLLLVRHS